MSSAKVFYTYITTNPGKTILYTGMTNNLKRRLSEHYAERGKTNHFASKFYCYRLFYYEIFYTPMNAIRREKEIKNLTREKKFELIKKVNSRLNFLVV